MYSKWMDIVDGEGLLEKLESDAHPHCKEEESHLFRTGDGGGTEFEILNLLNAFVKALKPRNVLETGTYKGQGTLAIAEALLFNGRGKVTTLENNDGFFQAAEAKLSKWGVMGVVDMVKANSLTWIGNYAGPTFDFAFLDSTLAIRPEELRLLVQQNIIGGMVLIHDTSLYRGLTCNENSDSCRRELLEIWKGDQQIVESNLSKGWTLLRV
jgi:predicted O-methyltransferase YrrM